MLTQAGNYCNAIQAALKRGRHEIAQLPVARGRLVNNQANQADLTTFSNILTFAS